MNLLTVVGIVLIAGGTFLTILGQQRDSKADIKAADQKVTQVLNRLDELQDDSISESQRDSLGKIETEFRDWAARFLSTLPDRKAELAQKQLQIENREIEASRQLRPIYQASLDALTGRLQALSASGGPAVRLDLPPLPSNLNSAENNYQGWIVFNPKNAWRVEIFPRALAPTLVITIGTEESLRHGQLSNSLTLIPRIGNNDIILDANGPSFQSFDMLPQSVALSAAKTELPHILTGLLELQLVRLAK